MLFYLGKFFEKVIEFIDWIKDLVMVVIVVFVYEFIIFFNGSNKVFEVLLVIVNNISYDWYL